MFNRAKNIAKTKWLCRRGMLELDLLLERFVREHVDALTDKQLIVFMDLLESPDPDLYAWLMGQEEPVDKEFADFVQKMRTNNYF